MFNKLIDWAVTNRLIVLLLLLITIGVIGWQLPNLKLDAFPDVTNVQVQVNTEAEGLAAEEVEQLITYPIEAVMYALPQVAEVRSISKTGLSIVTVVFEEGTDIYFARQLVFERLQAAREDIPEGVGTPEMGPNTSGLGQVYQYLLTAQPGSGIDAMQLRSLNDWVVKLLLMPVGGVTDVLSYGGDVRQYQVNVNPTRLLAYDLTLQQVMDAIAANNRNAGGWYLDRGAEQLVIRGMGWVGSGEQGLADIAAIPLKEVDGTQVRVSDVAKVEFGGEIRQGALTMTRRDANGEPEALGEVVAGIVLKRMGANTKATIDGIKDREARIRQALPDGVEFQVFYDQADLVEKAVGTVVTALLLAFVFIVIVLALFLMNLRATALVLLSIPLSIGLALLVMASLDMSANLMSLGGLAVAIGMLVDGSVVMVENIFKHLSRVEGSHDQPGGIALRVKDAAQEVARPVFFAASIILVVFMPLFAFEGVEAKMFVPMAISIMLAMAAAVLVALIVVPALAGFLFRRGVEDKPNRLMQWLEARYRAVLARAMQARKVVIGGAVGLFALALATTPFIGTEFVPVLEEGTLALRVTLAPSSSLDTALAVGEKLEQEIMTFPEVTYALSRVGRAEIGGDPEPVSNVEIYIGLKPVSAWESASNRLELQEKIQQKLAVHPGLLLNFSQPIAMRVDELLSGVKAQLAIKLFGPEGSATGGHAGSQRPQSLWPQRQSGHGSGQQWPGRRQRRAGDQRQRTLRHLCAAGTKCPQQRRSHPQPAPQSRRRCLGAPDGGGGRIPGVRPAANQPRRRATPRGHPGQRGRSRHGLRGGRYSTRHRHRGGSARRLQRGHRRPVRKPAARPATPGHGGARGRGAYRPVALLRLRLGRPGRPDPGQRAFGPHRRHPRPGDQRPVPVRAQFRGLYHSVRGSGVEWGGDGGSHQSSAAGW